MHPQTWTNTLQKLTREAYFGQFVQQANALWQKEQIERQRFIDEIPDDVKAEFINGKIIMSSPNYNHHLIVLDNLHKLISNYVFTNDLGFVGGEKACCRFTRNDYEPDLSFWRKEISQHFENEQYLFPVPDLIVEVLSSSTKRRDRTIKFNDYALHGVKEYWMVEPKSERFLVEQFTLSGKEYKLHNKLSEGKLSSVVLKGFSLKVEWLSIIGKADQIITETSQLKGEKKGIEIGETKGIQIGIEREQEKAILNLHQKLNLTPQQIAETLDIPLIIVQKTLKENNKK